MPAVRVALTELPGRERDCGGTPSWCSSSLLLGCSSARPLRAILPLVPLVLLVALVVPAGAQTLISICLEVESPDHLVTTTSTTGAQDSTETYRPPLLKWTICDKSTDPPTQLDIPSNIASFQANHRQSTGQGDNLTVPADVSSVCSANACSCEIRERGPQSFVTVSEETPEASVPVCGTEFWGSGPDAGHAWHYWMRGLDSDGVLVASSGDDPLLHELPVNKAPRFLEAPAATRTVRKDAQPGDKVGAPISAVDPEGRALTYSLGGADSDSFAIDSRTGQLTVGNNTTFDSSPEDSRRV